MYYNNPSLPVNIYREWQKVIVHWAHLQIPRPIRQQKLRDNRLVKEIFCFTILRLTVE